MTTDDELLSWFLFQGNEAIAILRRADITGKGHIYRKLRRDVTVGIQSCNLAALL